MSFIDFGKVTINVFSIDAIEYENNPSISVYYFSVRVGNKEYRSDCFRTAVESRNAGKDFEKECVRIQTACQNRVFPSSKSQRGIGSFLFRMKQKKQLSLPCQPQYISSRRL